MNTDVDDLDITNTEEVLNFGIVNRPDVIINCCGVTDTVLQRLLLAQFAVAETHGDGTNDDTDD